MRCWRERAGTHGSPNPRGSTYLLADAFCRGAQECGHAVKRIDVAHARLALCGGCVACGYDGPCVQQDDMEWIGAAIVQADMLVLATPLYYYGMSAQLKTAIDRFLRLQWPHSAQTHEVRAAQRGMECGRLDL